MSLKSRALREALAIFEGAGHVVRGLRLYPNGTIDLLTEGPPESPVANDEGKWVSLAGTPEIPRAKGA